MAAIGSNQREKEIFEGALDLESFEERLGYIKGACGNDAALLARVRALLQAHDDASRFLSDAPGSDLQETLVARQLSLEAAPGDRIGRYKLRETIGEGGCGIVYVAEQEEPVRRRVALKVIKPGMDSKSVIARPPSAAYRFQKLVRRNKFAIATVAVVSVTLMLGTLVSTWQAVLATRARNDAREAASREREQHRRAEGQAELTRQNLYASEMVLGLQALESKNFGFARDLLNRHRSRPDQPDLRGWEWRYLWGATRSDALFDLGSHSNGVFDVAFSPEGKLLATSSSDHTVKLWNTETGRELAHLQHDSAVRTAAFTADGRQLVTACFLGNLRTWDVATRSEISRLSIGRIDPLTGRGCAFSGDGERFANGQADGTVTVWDVAAGKKITTLRAEGPLFCLAFSRDGNLLAGGGRFTNWVGAWNLRTGELFCSFTNHTVPVDAVAFSPSGQTLAVANHDGSIKLWDLTERKPLRTLLGHSSWVPGVNFSPDGRHLVSASTDHTAILWDLDTGENKNSFEHLNEVFAVAFSHDGTTLATGTKIDGAVALWSALPRARKKTFELLHGGSRDHTLSAPVLAPDGTALLERYEDNRTLGVWDTLELRETTRFTLEYDSATRFAISPSGKLLAIGNENGAIKLLELATRQEIARFTNSPAAVWHLTFSLDGARLAARTADHKIRAWDVEIKRLVAEIEANPSSVASVHSSGFTFSPDGMSVGIGYSDRSAEIVDLVTGRRRAHLKEHKATVSSVVLLPDGKTAATASYDQAVKLWDLETQRELATLRGEWLACFALAASPDGRRLASGGGESTIRLWDTPTRQLVAIIRGTPGDEIVHLAFSPDGNTLVAITRYTLRVWRSPTLAKIDLAEKPDKANENK